MKSSLLITALAGITLAGSASAGIVNAGAATGYQSTNKDWLSETTNDIDGNGLGTDGFIFFGDFDSEFEGNANPINDQNGNIFGANTGEIVVGNGDANTNNGGFFTTLQPSYISVASTGANSTNVGQFSGYEDVDSPIALDGTDGVAGHLLVTGSGASALEFTVDGLAADTTVRVGVLVAVLNDDNRARFDIPEVGLTDGTDTVSITGLPNLSDGTAGPSVGWVFFDIDADGDYTVSVPVDTAGPNPDVTSLGGITFDSVPEPNSLALMGLGGLMMSKRRRRD